jgi:hypothetical protein
MHTFLKKNLTFLTVLMYSVDPKTGTYRMVCNLVFHPQSCDFLKPDQVFAGKRFEYNPIPVQ